MDKKNLFCVHCGKDFIPKRRNQTYCSAKCRDRRRYKRQVDQLASTFCLQCGKDFKPVRKWQKFCSRDCQNFCNNFIEELLNIYTPPDDLE